MIKVWYIILLFFFVSVNSFSKLNDFNKANELFNAGEYKASADIYEALIVEGYKESEVYYNLGNSYFRLNNIPKAILNYERAKKLNPSDDDIDFNLQIANLKIVDKFEPIPKLFLIEWYETLITLLYSGDWGYVIVSSVWLFFILLFLIFFGFFPGIRKYLVLLLFISFTIVLISSFFGYKAYKNENTQNYGIIYQPSVYVKSAPDPGSTDLFILHEGTKILIMEGIDNWIQIKLENGDIGWIDKSTIEII